MQFWSKLFGFKKQKIWYYSESIYVAAREGNVEEIKALLKDSPHLVSCRDDDGVAPLHIAATLGHANVAKLLIANKADVNAETDPGGFTPLHWAVSNGHKEVVKLLLANRADVNARDKSDGWTPLHHAVSRNHEDVVKLLLSHKADADAKSKSGETSLDCAVHHGHGHIAEVLRQHGGQDTIAPDTTIHEAIRQGDLEKTRALLRNSPHMTNSKDNNGQTPLHVAAYNGKKDVAQLLLANRAKVNATDNDGQTPLHLAVQTPLRIAVYNDRNKDVAQLLLANKANVNARDNDGNTPLYALGGRARKTLRNCCASTAAISERSYKAPQD